MGKLLQDDMSGIGKLLQDIMSGYIVTCCMGTLMQDFMNWYTVYLLQYLIYVQVIASEYMATATCCMGKLLQYVMSGQISIAMLAAWQAISICFWKPFSYCHLLLLQNIVSGYITTAIFSMAMLLQDVM